MLFFSLSEEVTIISHADVSYSFILELKAAV